MWEDPEADGCVYDTTDCHHNCKGCDYGIPEDEAHSLGRGEQKVNESERGERG
jgi:hypothetical protein